MGEVGDDDRTAPVPGDLVEQALHRGARGDQAGQFGAYGLGEADGGELAPQQPGLHLLGQLGEGERPVQDDHGQPAPLGRPPHHVRRGGEGTAEAEHDGRRLRPVQGADVLALFVLVTGEQHTGGEDHLAAAEHHADVGGLGHVHPAHRPVEPVRAGHHLGLSGQHPFQAEDLTDRQGGFPGLLLQGDGCVRGGGHGGGSSARDAAVRCSAGRVRGSPRPPRPPRR